MALNPETRRQILAARDRYPSPRSAVVPALWAVQDELGFLTPEGMAEVADLLHLAPSEVQAVSTFYSMYFDRPAGAHHVLVCVNVSCALRGGDDIVSHLEKRLGCPSGGTSADGRFTWESTVECLGACGGAPAMQVDHHFHENLTADRVDSILELVGAQAASHGRRADAAPSRSGPHPPAGETPPATTAEGPPAAASGDGTAASEATRAPAVEQPEMPGSKTRKTANPQGSRSAPRRKRPRPDARDL
ncbi:MAG: NADH-quinone oxidoreductase subunit NuoE [Candidatus Dormibacteraeota bacterium]|nr:NADH-quinone oxidoreductase subunit NuoE [Candidatus Dormibacteraeota bacterium]